MMKCSEFNFEILRYDVRVLFSKFLCAFPFALTFANNAEGKYLPFEQAALDFLYRVLMRETHSPQLTVG